MKLYLLRHGEAAPLGDGGITDDADRPLTETGLRQIRALAGQMQRRGIGLKAVLSSPLLRAKQTAETLVKTGPFPALEVRICDDLAFNGKPRRIARLLRELKAESVALVGHAPDLNQLAGWLIGSKKAQVDLAKGAVAHILSSEDVRKGSGALLWMLTPEWVTS